MLHHRSTSSLAVTGALFLLLVPACAGKRTAVRPATVTSGEAPAAAPPPAAVAVATGGVLPTGATVMVRTIDVISTESVQTGTPFEAVLAQPINDADGTELVPDGAKVYGRVLEAGQGGAARKPKLAIGLTSIQTPARMVPLATTVAGAEGDKSGAVKKVGAATLVGAAAGNAGAGAAVGGAAVLMSGKNQIVIPRGTLIEFNLTQPAQLR